jgi:hypothetical protein
VSTAENDGSDPAQPPSMRRMQQCHECGRGFQVGDRFCTGCGISLAGVSEPTEAVPAITAEPPTAEHPVVTPAPVADPITDPITDDVVTGELPTTELVARVDEADADAEDWGDVDPVWAATGALPVVEPATTSDVDDLWSDPTPIGVVAPTPAPAPMTEPVPVTAPIPVTAAMPIAPAPVAAAVDHRFRFTATTLLGLLGGIVLLVAMFASIVEVSSSAPVVIGDDAPAAFRLGTWIADDLGDNLSVAGLLAALSMVLGGVAASFGWRWGSGLAGGGGLAGAGLAALAIGLAQYPIDAAHEFAAVPTDQLFTLTITKSLGYWLLIAAGALGVVVFFASTNDAFSDHRGGLNPWIAAIGALGVAIATAGPLLPVDLAVFSDNWYVIERPGEAPAMLVAMRIVQLMLFGLGGVVGFLSVRRWGLGVAAGATLPSVWLGVSTLFEIGSSPVGLAFRNPGAPDTALHGVTIIGLSAVFALTLLAAVAAYDQSVRER